MAHFAWLDANNIVTNVSVVDNVNLLDENGEESEAVGIAYLTSVHGEGKVWVQTSYHGNPVEGASRGKYAGIGDLWDGTEFTTPQADDDSVA
jgi:hypothetical protein